MIQQSELLFPNEPLRFGADNFEAVLAHCSKMKASDITLQTGEEVIAEVSGRLYKITKHKLSTPEVGDILNLLYGPNGTTQILSGRDVDTHYEFRPTRTERYRFRVNGTGCQVEGHHGIQLTLRTIPAEPPKLESLNLQPEIINAISPHEGVVYVTGPTGSGKSTLLAAIIRNIVEDPDCNRKVLTYEAPIEFVFDAVNKPTAVVSQSEIPRHLPTFADGVRNALRRKPRLILVGEARDPEIISAVIEAALTGHPVYTTLHTTGVPETIRRLVGTFPADERGGRTIDIIETLRLVICQKLVPTIDGKQVALREFLAFNEEVRDILLESDPNQVTSVTRRLLNESGQTMLHDAKKKFEEKIIPEREYKIIMSRTKYSEKQ
ncbi:MAG: Dot/Icm type IV secretion system ATPase DotB [Coxiellaceae bacterium]|jgi:defect-in-organelle-trafficking protein DotB|nr:Dot/Icm type IV secretion system ATPase DotB [Coxiellaceae bacterium]